MESPKFTVIFQGRLLAGFEVNQVKGNLRQCFKLSTEQVEKLFSGREIVLKRELPQERALLYRNKLRECGADCTLRPTTENSGESHMAVAPVYPESATATGAFGPSGKTAPSAAPPHNSPAIPLYVPLYQAFYSGNLYRNIAHQWQVGRAFLYMLLLVVVTQLPLIGYTQFKTSRYIEEYADLLPQIPKIRLHDRTLTSECQVPCILQHQGRDTVIIDASGTRETLTASDARILINTSAVLIEFRKGQIEDYEIPTNLDLTIDRSFVEKWLPAANWLWLLLILTLIPTTYLVFCLKALFYGWIASYMAKRHLAGTGFDKVLVLTIVCLTPIAVLNTLLKPVLNSTPLLAAMVLTIFILNLAVRQHGQGERERITSAPRQTYSRTGRRPPAQNPSDFAGTLSFHYNSNFNYLILTMIVMTSLPFLLLLNQVGEIRQLLFTLSVATLVILTLTVVIMYISKKNPVAALDGTALSLSQITIPWTQIHTAREKTTNLGLFRWRSLVLSGSFKAPFTGNRLNLPLSLIAKADELVEAISRRVTRLDEADLRSRAIRSYSVTDEEIRYRKMRFTSSGITTNRESIPWSRVTALTGQTNVIAGLSSLTLGYLDDADRNATLTIPPECSKSYQGAVAFAIAHAGEAKADQELIKLLETDAVEARSSYLILGVVMFSVAVLILAVGVVESYRFPFPLRMGLIPVGVGVWALAFNKSIMAGVRGNKISLLQKKFWAWGTLALPILALTLGLATTPISRSWLLGDLNAKLGSVEAAESHYQHALALSDNDYLIMFDLGNLYMDHGWWEKAFEYLDPPVREHIRNWTPDAVLYVPEALMYMGKRDEAIAWCEGVLKDPKIPGDVETVLANKLQEIRSGLNR
jgi:hypothetical protein